MSWVGHSGGCKGDAGEKHLSKLWGAFGALGSAAPLLSWAAAEPCAVISQSQVTSHPCFRMTLFYSADAFSSAWLPRAFGNTREVNQGFHPATPWPHSAHHTDPAQQPDPEHCTIPGCGVTCCTPQLQGHSLANNLDLPSIHLWGFLIAAGGEAWSEALLIKRRRASPCPLLNNNKNVFSFPAPTTPLMTFQSTNDLCISKCFG